MKTRGGFFVSSCYGKCARKNVSNHFARKADPTGKDMEWWRAHRADFADLE
jgi:hypothetical protein